MKTSLLVFSAFLSVGSFAATAMPTIVSHRGVTVPRDGKRPFVLTPTGYTLEIWADGAWGAPVAYAGTSYLHTVAAQPSPVRLTWKWHGDDGMALIVR